MNKPHASRELLSSSDYRPELDGLRGVAVLSVLLYHAEVPGFGSGFFGVDIFFVISGFLITSIILKSAEQNEFSFTHFYAQRARRLLPALTAVCLVSFVFAYWLLPPYAFKEFSQSLISVSTFLSNIYFSFKSGYFDAASTLKPLLHTWSLAVEEQFYLFFPLFLLFFAKRGGQSIFGSVLGITFLSFIFSESLARVNPDLNFFLPIGRFWEILAGALVACGILGRKLSGRGIFADVGLLLIGVGFLTFDESTRSPSISSGVFVIGAALILAFGNLPSVSQRILSSRLLVNAGLVSYSLYLWHQPIFAYYRQYNLGIPISMAVKGFLVLFCVAVAYVSWRFIESPFRKGGLFTTSDERTIGLGAAALLVLGAFGYVGHVTNGLPARNPEMALLQQNYGLSPACSGASLEESRCFSKSEPGIAVWGDSYAMHFSKALATAFPSRGVQQMTLSACTPGVVSVEEPRKTTRCRNFNSDVQTYLQSYESRSIKTVVVSASANLAAERNIENFEELIKFLQSTQRDVVVVGPTPRKTGTAACIQRSLRQGGGGGECSYKLSEARNYTAIMQLRTMLGRLNVPFIGIHEFLCPQDECVVERGGVLALRDEGHMTVAIQDELAIFLSQRL